MRDLKKTILIYLKGFLLAAIVLYSAFLLFSMCPAWQTGFLIVLISWASARAYYFMFYVIEKYVDSRYRFSGVLSFIQYLLSRKKGDSKSSNVSTKD
jgi:hypothetical protein